MQNRLIEACKNNNVEAARDAINAGIAIDGVGIVEGAAVTPLMIAVNERNHELVELLLQGGANPDQFFRVADGAPKYLSSLMFEENNVNILQLLLLFGAKPELIAVNENLNPRIDYSSLLG